MEKRIEAAHNATRDSFLAKVFVDPEAFNGYDLVSAQTECIADTKEHITNNLDRYINILKAAMSRYVDGIRKMTFYREMPDSLVYAALKRLPDWMVAVNEQFDKRIYEQ